MAVIGASRTVDLSQTTDIKKSLIEWVGDISALRVAGTNLLVGKYIHPEKTAGGVIRAPVTIKEDEYQGNVGLVLKVGEGFDDEMGEGPLHQWVLYGYNDGLNIIYNGIACKIMPLERVRAFDVDPTKVL